jgi:hypothetical protein
MAEVAIAGVAIAGANLALNGGGLMVRACEGALVLRQTGAILYHDTESNKLASIKIGYLRSRFGKLLGGEKLYNDYIIGPKVQLRNALSNIKIDGCDFSTLAPLVVETVVLVKRCRSAQYNVLGAMELAVTGLSGEVLIGHSVCLLTVRVASYVAPDYHGLDTSLFPIRCSFCFMRNLITFYETSSLCFIQLGLFPSELRDLKSPMEQTGRDDIRRTC